MAKQKILILYASFGVGHGAAAKAIAEEFALEYPDIEVKNIDVLDFVIDIFKQSLPWAYSQVTSKIPFLYKWIYNYYNYKSRYKFLNYVSGVILKKSKFIKFIKDFNPDFIISTNPLSMQLVSLTKEKNIINILSANVCTDFGFYSLWHNKDVNYYFVANEEAKNSLVKYSVDGQKIMVTGIPTSLKFRAPLGRLKIVSDLKFDISKPILLIVGGKISYKKLAIIVDGIKEKYSGAQFVIVAGRDAALWEKIKDSSISKDTSVRVFGFIDNLEDYMTAADLILTKAGGLTVSECLVKNLPVVINDIIPGQEEDNANYAVKEGAGIKTKGAEEAVEVVSKLFLQPEKLAAMKENCKKIAKPNAAKDLVDFIVLRTKD